VSVGTCPNGHPSNAGDYCDTCGAPMGDGAGAAVTSSDGAPAPSGAAPKACPSCGTESPADALFCESCGYDFTTGAMPRAATAAAAQPPTSAPSSTQQVAAEQPPVAPSVPLEWVAEVWVDPDWYAEQESDEPCPSPGLPVVVPLTVKSVLVGRTSQSRSIHPEIDCSDDAGVSRRQAQLTTDGTRWWVEDLQSSNGTYVGPASGPLPTRPLLPGQRQELADDDRIYVGAWTRVVLRRATQEEKAH
jgi:hypothetical protein